MARMGLEQQLTDTLTRAIKDKDAPTANVVRMLKTKLQERRTARGLLRHRGRRARRRRDRRLSQAAPEGARGVREGRASGARSRPPSSASRSSSASAGCRRGWTRRRCALVVRERLAALGIADAQAGGAPGGRRHEDAQGPGRGGRRQARRGGAAQGRRRMKGVTLPTETVFVMEMSPIKFGLGAMEEIGFDAARLGLAQGPDLHRPQSRRRGPARPACARSSRAGRSRPRSTTASRWSPPTARWRKPRSTRAPRSSTG